MDAYYVEIIIENCLITIMDAYNVEIIIENCLITIPTVPTCK